MMTSAAPIPAGFADPTLDSQAVFRAVLTALARPGQVVAADVSESPPPPLMPATAAIGLTLFDLSTPVWVAPDLASPSATEYLAFHTGCTLAPAPEAAAFAILAGDDILDDLPRFALGTPEYPDRSSTLIVQVETLTAGHGLRLTGPGIEHEHRLSVTGVASGFWDFVRRNAQLFPLGVDFILVAGDRLACLPRTTRVED